MLYFKELFKISFAWYFLLLFLDQIFRGFTSHWLNLNWLLWLVIILGIIFFALKFKSGQ